MDHVVYLEAKERELDRLFSGEKRMVVRGATGRKLPYGRVYPGDVLWFVENSGDGLVRGRAAVQSVFNSDRLTEQESRDLLSEHQGQLCLTLPQVKRWAGKRYLVLIGLEQVQQVPPFAIDRSGYGNMDDWLPVEEIDRVRK